MTIPQEVIDAIRGSKATYQSLANKHYIPYHYVRAIKLGKTKFNDKKDFKPEVQEKDYPFGKYPKTKYEVYSYKNQLYSFVTTIHSEEECIDFLLDRITPFHKEVRLYKTIGGVRFKI